MRYVIQYICFHNASKKQKIIIKNDCNTDGSGKFVSCGCLKYHTYFLFMCLAMIKLMSHSESETIDLPTNKHFFRTNSIKTFS